MGKSSRNQTLDQKIRKEAQQKVREFLRLVGYVDLGNFQANWNRIEDLLGSEFCSSLHEAVVSRQQSPSDDSIYDLVYRDEETMKVLLGFLSPMAANFLEILFREQIEGRVLELCCGTGLASCFLAWTNPTLEVVGIDKNERSIAFAVSLSNSLGLRNVTFSVVELEALDSGQGFDSVISCAGYRESDAWRFEGEPGFSWVKSLNDGLPKNPASFVRCIDRNLGSSGRLTCLERADFATAAFLLTSLDMCGLGLDPTSSTTVDYSNNYLDSKDCLLAIFANRAGHLEGNTLPDLFNKISELSRWSPDIAAEVVIKKGVKFVSGLEAHVMDRDGEGWTRLLLLEQSGSPICYRTTSRGHRSILAKGKSAGQYFDVQSASLRAASDVVGIRVLNAQDFEEI